MTLPRPLSLVLAASLLALASAPGRARAEGPQHESDQADAPDPDLVRARHLFYEGRKLFDLRRFEQALAKYEAAFEAKPIPEFLFNIGQCHRNLGNYDEAIFSFRRYLQLVPDADRRPQIEKLIAELRAKKKQAAEKARSARLLGAQPEQTGHPPSRPIYKKWWFWTGVAVVAVAAGATTLALTGSGGGLPTTDLGNVDFGQ